MKPYVSNLHILLIFINFYAQERLFILFLDLFIQSQKSQNVCQEKK